MKRTANFSCEISNNVIKEREEDVFLKEEYAVHYPAIQNYMDKDDEIKKKNIYITRVENDLKDLKKSFSKIKNLTEIYMLNNSNEPNNKIETELSGILRKENDSLICLENELKLKMLKLQEFISEINQKIKLVAKDDLNAIEEAKKEPICLHKFYNTDVENFLNMVKETGTCSCTIEKGICKICGKVASRVYNTGDKHCSSSRCEIYPKFYT